jgi:hypothetical protein
LIFIFNHRLFHEKVREIDERMKHISEEEADEYLQPLKELEEARQRRIQTAGIYNSAVSLYVLIQLPFFSELQCSCKVSW